jgi:hypothetical protein
VKKIMVALSVFVLISVVTMISFTDRASSAPWEEDGFIPSGLDYIDLIQFGTEGDDSDGTVDSASNPRVFTHHTGIYVAGNTKESFPDITKPGDNPDSSERWDGYLIRFDFDGKVIWKKMFGTNRTDWVRGLYVDSRYIYVSGSTKGSFPSYRFNGGLDGFIVIFDFNGNEISHHQFGEAETDWTRTINVVGGRIFVTGRYNSETVRDYIFIREFRYDPGGTWTEVNLEQIFTTAQIFEASESCIFGSRLFLTGYMFETEDLIYEDDPGIPIREDNTGGWDCYLLSYDINGEVEWINRFGASPVWGQNTSGDRSYGITADENGVYVTGYTDGNFPGFELPDDGQEDSFVRKYSHSGTQVLWTWQSEVDRYDKGNTVTIDGEYIYCSGMVDGMMDDSVTYFGSFDSYTVKIDRNTGQLDSDWSKQYGSKYDDTAWSSSAYESKIYVSGCVKRSMCGVGQEFNQDTWDGYLVRINHTSEPPDEECPPCPEYRDCCIIIIIIVIIFIIIILIILIFFCRRR